LWDKKCQNAFDNLKRALTSTSILSFLKEDGEFILDTDASNIGDAILSQVQEGEEKIIAYFSCVLSKTEKKYCITRRELLAIIDSIKSFPLSSWTEVFDPNESRFVEMVNVFQRFGETISTVVRKIAAVRF